MLKVLFLGSCWTTNIGNAFVNLGAISTLRQAIGNKGRVYHLGGMSLYLFWLKGRPDNNLDLAGHTDFDYVVNAGMTQCRGHMEVVAPLFRELAKKGTKVIILGGGAGKYSENEVACVRQLCKGIPIHAFVSRDTYSFEKYADTAVHSYDGLDSAFFIVDDFVPVPVQFDPYNVLCFDQHREPQLLNVREARGAWASRLPAREKPLARRVRDALRAAVAKRKRPLAAPAVPVLDMEGRAVLRTHHTTWCNDLRPEYFVSPDCLISDLPGDYLSLYGQAEAVYSDRVHACIPTLAFGKRAMLVNKQEQRLRMFARVGAPEIADHPVCLDMDRLRQEKLKQVGFVRTVLGL